MSGDKCKIYIYSKTKTKQQHAVLQMTFWDRRQRGILPATPTSIEAATIRTSNATYIREVSLYYNASSFRSVCASISFTTS